jgi:tRNA-modifying protein YgfZ
MSAELTQHSGTPPRPPRAAGDLRGEYEAIRGGVAVLDLSAAGKLEVGGRNAVQFVNGLVTNDVKALGEGEGVLAAFLNAQGKVVAVCRIYSIGGRAGERLLIELDPARRETIYNNLSRFVPAGEFFVSDVTGRDALISLQGPHAAQLIERLTGGAAGFEPEYGVGEYEWEGVRILAASHSRAGGVGFDLFVPAEHRERVREAVLARGALFGALEVGPEVLEVARIEAGIPREGVDVTEENILLEAGYEKAVSYKKGCYLGQEIIARIHWRGQPAKQLRGLFVEADEVPPRGTELYAEDGKKVGEVTSATRSLGLNRVIALGYVHRYYLAAGTAVTLRQGGAEFGSATVTELPFIREQA